MAILNGFVVSDPLQSAFLHSCIAHRSMRSAGRPPSEFLDATRWRRTSGWSRRISTKRATAARRRRRAGYEPFRKLDSPT